MNQGGDHGEDPRGSFLGNLGRKQLAALARGNVTNPVFTNGNPRAGTQGVKPSKRMSIWNRLHTGKRGGKRKTRRGSKLKKNKTHRRR